jgi:hypothetical protein
MNISRRLKIAGITALTGLVWGFSVSPASATVTTIPQSSLIPTTQYYTEQFSVGGLGTALLMTGGGNAANVGSSRNDDGFSGPINLGFTFSMFGHSYTQFYANNNGNISFNAGISAFTPIGPQGAAQPVISPFFADVDTRGAASGVMSLNTSNAGEIIVTWDQVGYFGAHDNLLNSFQLVLRADNYVVPAGEGQIGFFWKTMQWETGDASGGTNGFGGTPAAVGFGDGQSNGFVLQGSTANGIAAVVQNHELWFNINTQTGEPEPVPGIPEPETYAMLLAGLGLLGFVARRRKQNAA